VEVFAAKDYATLIEAQLSSRIEYAVYSASAFSAAWSLCKCVQPLAAPSSAEGATGFRSILIAAKKSSETLSGLKGKTILIAGKSSFSGYLLPQQQLASQGIDITSDGWKLDILDGMETAVAGLKKGDGSALFGWIPAFDKNDKKISSTGTIADLGRQAEQFNIVWRSSPIPFGPHAIRNNLDKRVQVILENFLMGLDKQNPKAYQAIENNFMGGFKLVDLTKYRPILNLIKQLTAPETENDELVLADPQQKKTP